MPGLGIEGRCGRGLTWAGGAQPAPALPGALLPSPESKPLPLLGRGEKAQVTVNNSKVHLMGKGVVSSFHSDAVCLVWVFFLKAGQFIIPRGGERMWMAQFFYSQTPTTLQVAEGKLALTPLQRSRNS